MTERTPRESCYTAMMKVAYEHGFYMPTFNLNTNLREIPERVKKADALERSQETS